MSSVHNSGLLNGSWNWSFCPACGNLFSACSCSQTQNCISCGKPHFMCYCLSSVPLNITMPNKTVTTTGTGPISLNTCPTCNCAWQYCSCSYVNPVSHTHTTSTPFTANISWPTTELFDWLEFVDALGVAPVRKIGSFFSQKNSDGRFSGHFEYLYLPPLLSRYFFELPTTGSLGSSLYQMLSPLVFSAKSKEKTHFLTLIKVDEAKLENDETVLKKPQFVELADNLQYIRLAERDISYRKALESC